MRSDDFLKYLTNLQYTFPIANNNINTCCPLQATLAIFSKIKLLILKYFVPKGFQNKIR